MTINLIFVVFLFHLFISVYPNSDFLFSTLANIARPFVFTVATAIAAILLKQKRKLASMLFAFIIIVQGVLLLSSWYKRKTPIEKGTLKKARVISVISYNLLGYNYKKGKPAKTIQFLKEQKVDVILLQEYSHYWHRRTKRIFKKRYRYQSLHIRRGASGFAVFSKLKIKRVHYIKKGKSSVAAQCFKLKLEPRWVHICNVHLKSPGGILKRRKRFISGFEKNYQYRKKQFSLIQKYLLANNTSSLPILLAGDFNTMKADPLHQHIAELYADALHFQSILPPLTFPNYSISPIPLLQIDYFFVNQLIEVIDSKVFYKGGSDHYPIFLKMRL